MSQNHSNSLLRKLNRITEQDLKHVAQATAELCLEFFACREPAESLRIFLHGNLGSGKTTWARYFLQACGVSGRIKSPSFSIVESYAARDIYFHHLDFFRQSDPKQWQSGGIRDLLAEPSIALIEWPERAHGLASPDIELVLAPAIESSDEHLRDLQIELKPKFQSRLKQSSVTQWLEAIKSIRKEGCL